MGRARRIDPLDFLAVNAMLGNEERAVQAGVRRLVRDSILPRIEGWYAAGRFPRRLARELGREGLLGMRITGYGCRGFTAVEYGLACMELDAGDSGVRSMVSVHGSLAMNAIARFGSEEQRGEWLPRMARGEIIGAFALTEPEAGSDPGSLATVARRTAGGFKIKGRKAWVTNGPIADLLVVWAKAGRTVRGFLVPTDSKGLDIQVVADKLSLRASPTAQIDLNNVVVRPDQVLPAAESLGAPLTCLNEGRFGVAWGAVGVARACLESALNHSRERRQFGARLASFQLVQARLAEMATKLNGSLLLAVHLGRLVDQGTSQPAQIGMAKRANVASARSVATDARQILGASGITQTHSVMRHLSNLETLVTYEGTADIHSLMIGEALTGISAFRAP